MVRIKNRYIVVRIVPQADAKILNFHDGVLAKCVLRNVKKYFGDYGLGIVEHGFRVKYCNERTKVAIIRCLHRSHRTLTATLPLITMKFLNEMVGQIVSAKERNDFIKRVMEFDLEQ
ncbi:ribonuclease P/MRP protein subunit POP5 isoform X2 [Eurosta solidaginis]|uniref:ribonuclease P/MRP protein subunit POP5 isoform X2 n=1 Tax=Eurosta solidaginis TaxID=178769 RepID=UPI00353134DB